MEITIGKILSLLVAAGYVVAAIVTEGWGAIAVCVVLLVPLGLIWFPDECGSFTGFVGRGGYVNQESPAILISFMGWLFLLGFPILIYFTSH